MKLYENTTNKNLKNMTDIRQETKSLEQRA